MKATLVFIGSLRAIQTQAREIAGFIEVSPSLQEPAEAWICTPETIEAEMIQLPATVAKTRYLQVPDGEIAEPYIDLISQIARETNSELLIFGHGSFLENIAVRTGKRLKGSFCTSITKINKDSDPLEIEKLLYAGHMKGSFQLLKKPYCLTLGAGFSGEIESLKVPTKDFDSNIALQTDCRWLLKTQKKVCEKKENLQEAKRTIVVGNGIASAKNIPQLKKLAQLIKAKLGASRPVVMNGWVDMEQLVGVSGTILAPELCIAVGVSGSAAFTVGVEKSQCLIAINKDTNAPIFSVADAGVCSDYHDVVDALIEKLQEQPEGGSK